MLCLDEATVNFLITLPSLASIFAGSNTRAMKSDIPTGLRASFLWWRVFTEFPPFFCFLMFGFRFAAVGLSRLQPFCSGAGVTHLVGNSLLGWRCGMHPAGPLPMKGRKALHLRCV